MGHNHSIRNILEIKDQNILFENKTTEDVVISSVVIFLIHSPSLLVCDILALEHCYIKVYRTLKDLIKGCIFDDLIYLFD